VCLDGERVSGYDIQSQPRQGESEGGKILTIKESTSFAGH
jgi:hypothetical protein